MRRRAAGATLAAALACLLSACGGGDDPESATGDVYRAEPARLCFENAGYSASLVEISPDVVRLRVLPEGGGPVYVSIIFARTPADAQRYAKGADEVRGNAVLRGPGVNDDAVTQCMLEASQPS